MFPSFVSREFELGRNVSCEELTVSSIWGYFLHFGSSFMCYEWVKLESSNFVRR